MSNGLSVEYPFDYSIRFLVIDDNGDSHTITDGMDVPNHVGIVPIVTAT